MRAAADGHTLSWRGDPTFPRCQRRRRARRNWTNSRTFVWRNGETTAEEKNREEKNRADSQATAQLIGSTPPHCLCAISDIPRSVERADRIAEHDPGQEAASSDPSRRRRMGRRCLDDRQLDNHPTYRRRWVPKWTARAISKHPRTNSRCKNREELSESCARRGGEQTPRTREADCGPPTAFYFLINAIFFSLIRPLGTWLSKLPIFRWIGILIRSLGPYPTLALFAVPLISEPVKPVGLYLIASGNVIDGTVLIGAGEIAKITIVERIFHAGRDKLMTIPAFAWSY